MIMVTKKIQAETSDDLVDESFFVNADKIVLIEDSKLDNWEKSTLILDNQESIEVVETKEYIATLIEAIKKI